MNLMVWNCQGAASKELNRVLKDLIKKFNPSVLGLLEPRVSGSHADDICNKMGYDNWLRVEAVGFSGAIWIFWKDELGLKIIYSHPQFVLVRVDTGTSIPWFLSIVYGSPNATLRKRLWNDLTKEKLNIEGPWVSLGDFNSVITEHEISTTGGVAYCRSAGFADWMFNQGLLDLGFTGSRFTWKRGNNSNTFKGARLDRGVCTIEWREMFPEAQAAWLTHSDFQNVIQHEWQDQRMLKDNVISLTNVLTEWNSATFGNIHKRKRELIARIDGVQRILGHQPRHRLLKLDAKLRRELDKVLEQEELLWYQKSREDWIVSGDRNTKFYHASTMVRRSRNKIEALKEENGNWITEEDRLKHKVQDYYTSLFGPNPIHESKDLGRGWFPRLPEAHSQALNASFVPEEIKRALFGMSPFKAPGPDGIPAGFYQKTWQIVGNSICEFALHYFEFGKMPVGTNDTLISLIPKVPNPEFITQFRPISVCNVRYKILTKTMTNRLKLVMADLVGPFQSSFVPGRQITDNIMVYQEALHTMRKKTGGKGYMAIKIDLEKAYDRLSWDFIRETLTEVGLNRVWVRNIMNCIESPRLSILWNGDQMEWINPSRGIRQGDSISPYIFVLCIERLSHIICQAVSNGSWKPIRLSRNGPPISHLLFADDMVLYAEASIELLNIILECLNSFCSCSGQKVNFHKSQIFVSKNVDDMVANSLSTASGIPLTDDLGKYLGVSSIHGRANNNLYKQVLDRIKSRLEGWKTKYLSFAGRKVLVQPVLNAIPLYTMQTSLLPMGICSEIEKTIRNFLWGRQYGERKCHLVKWEVVTKPKSMGGLGIRRMQQMNLAFMTKLGWRLMNDKNSLWAQVLKEKYMHKTNISKGIQAKQGASKTWQDISKAMQTLEQGKRSVVRNGKSTSFWMDKWLENEPLNSYLLKDIEAKERNKSVFDYWIRGEGWNWGDLGGKIPTHVEDKLAACILSEEEDAGDRICWGLTSSGNFSISSAYELIMGIQNHTTDNLWGMIWKLEVPYRIRAFLWLVRHEKIMSNVERVKRGFTTSGMCVMCQNDMEDVDHIFRKCEKAREIWRCFMSTNAFQNILKLSFDEWFRANLGQERQNMDTRNWNVLFAITLWWLWKWRNDLVFNNKRLDVHLKVKQLKNQLNEIKSAFSSSRVMPSHTQRYANYIVRWIPPPEGWCSLEVDGSCKQSIRKAGGGGLLRNEYGDWMIGFMHNIGWCSIEEAKLWAAYKGLQMAWEAGQRKIMLGIDSIEVIK
ncbi:uncharacterized protein LOC142545090 [Primulina tabacum]|uniref:uncharacterized protein LOC142545090 n=1 Tax=Primulina tabacum TaxID=48773 RepID=UPI003F5A9E39